jgi:hypothetical protein
MGDVATTGVVDHRRHLRGRHVAYRVQKRLELAQMAVGLHAVNLANPWLDMLGNTAFTAKATTAVKAHTGDPGSAGTANASAETDRKALTWAAAAAGAKAIQATLPQWAAWDAGTETISHMGIWDSTTAGNFLYSFALTVAKQVQNGDTLNLTSHSVSFTPIAA